MSDADAFLFRGEDDGADFHFGGGGVRRIPIDRDGAAEIDGNFLEQLFFVLTAGGEIL